MHILRICIYITYMHIYVVYITYIYCVCIYMHIITKCLCCFWRRYGVVDGTLISLTLQDQAAGR